MPIIGSSIQGTPDAEITPEQMLVVGRTLGIQYKHITVGRNIRPSSRMMFSSLISGMMSSGATVRDAGIIPTPVIPFASEDSECAVMIGNPNDNDRISGATLMNPDGRLFTDSQMFAFSNRLYGEKLICDYSNVGNVDIFNGAIDIYTRKVTDLIGTADCQVVIDCASDSASLVMPRVFADMGSDAITVNCQTDGRSAGRESSPDAINIRSLIKVVKANFGSIGVATNGDGSRIAAVDEGGEYITGSQIFQLLVKYLNPKSIAVPVDTSMAINDITDAKIYMTRVGSEHLGDTVKNNDLEFGGCNDGSFVFKDISYCNDGITAAAYLTKMASESSLQDLLEEIPEYHRFEDSVPYMTEREGIAKRVSSKIADVGYRNLCIVDGWRAEMDEGWFLIRFSDRTQNIEIVAEGLDKVYAASLMEMAKDIVIESIRPA